MLGTQRERARWREGPLRYELRDSYCSPPNTLLPHKALLPQSAFDPQRALLPHNALLPQSAFDPHSALLPHNAFVPDTVWACAPDTNCEDPHTAEFAHVADVFQTAER